MDVLERLNRRFGSWYEGLFGASPERDLRPREILRRILAAMEDQRREGLDGQIYVPNSYSLQIAVHGDEERQYLLTFLDAQELASAVRRSMEQHGYKTRGGLKFTIEEAAPESEDDEARVHILCRFDPSVPDRPAPVESPEDVDDRPHPVPPAPRRPLPDFAPRHAAQDEEPGTVPAPGAAGQAYLLSGATGERYPLGPGGTLIGRSRQSGNDVILANDSMVSKRHARIAFERGRYVCYDERSTNGTFVNETLIAAGQGHPLSPGDTVRVGATTLTFQPGGGGIGAAQQARPTQAASAAPAHSPPPQPQPRPEAPAAAGPVGAGQVPRASFVLVAGDGETFPLASEMTVGRAFTSDIALEANGVSAQHARVSIRPDTGQVYVEDLGSAGGTSVNGQRIPVRFPVVLYPGDQIAIGEALLRLERRGG